MWRSRSAGTAPPQDRNECLFEAITDAALTDRAEDPVQFQNARLTVQEEPFGAANLTRFVIRGHPDLASGSVPELVLTRPSETLNRLVP
jgi:hypothetical protein